MEILSGPPADLAVMAGHTIGYHGCTAEKARQMEETDFFQPSRSQWDWLGEGMYFWERGYGRARQWAERRRSIGDREPVVVYGAAIRLEKYLDLSDLRGADLAQELLAILDVANNPDLPTNSKPGQKHELDCYVVNLLCDEVAKVTHPPTSVRAAFEEGPSLFSHDAGSTVLKRESHVQIAVRDPSVLTRVWRQPS